MEKEPPPPPPPSPGVIGEHEVNPWPFVVIFVASILILLFKVCR